MAEQGPVEAVVRQPRHPYTKGLISCVPRINTDFDEDRPPLTEVPGIVPALGEFGKDLCLFASRCPHVTAQCQSARPGTHSFPADHLAACWHAEDLV